MSDSGDKIKTHIGNFSFGKNTPKNFDSHIGKSVPLYNMGQELIANLSSFFLVDGSKVYDLGCSTGTISKKIVNYNKKIDIKVFAVDIEKKMLKKAKSVFSRKEKKKIKLVNKDLVKLKLKKSDMIVSYYTLQFIKPKFRQDIFNKIYKSLNWGGAFILFEKVRGPDARFQDIFTQIYHEFKNKNGFTESQIYNKALSIRGMLEPFTSRANVDFMKRAGFKDITPILKYCPFEGFLAIK